MQVIENPGHALVEDSDTDAPAMAPSVVGAVLAGSAVVSACGGGGGGGASPPSVPTPTPTPAPVQVTPPNTYASTDEEAVRFLLQAQFSASDAENWACSKKRTASSSVDA